MQCVNRAKLLLDMGNITALLAEIDQQMASAGRDIGGRSVVLSAPIIREKLRHASDQYLHLVSNVLTLSI